MNSERGTDHKTQQFEDPSCAGSATCVWPELFRREVGDWPDAGESRQKVLILNSGSSSIKFKLFDADGGQQVCGSGIAERIGLSGAAIRYCFRVSEGNKYTNCFMREPSEVDIPNHSVALELICKLMLDEETGIVNDVSDILGIGHRVVHGGEKFLDSVIVDDAVIEGINECARLAPLHNPPALRGIEAAREHFPNTPQVAVFDTAFHHTMPPWAYLYGIPKRLYEEHGIRKYGFHGTSHKYVAEKAAAKLEKPIEDTKIITCHLGNGSSITAVKGGKSVDTSMGLTPLAGVMMGTRSGDLDPYIPLFMIRDLGMTPDEAERTLNRESGLEGICRHTDMRDIEALAAEGDHDAELALDMFAYRIAQYVGAYAMVMDGVDAIVMTAGIGEKDALMRKRILKSARYLGVELDEEANNNNAERISTPESKVAALVIPTNEELMIARDTLRLVHTPRSRRRSKTGMS